LKAIGHKIGPREANFPHPVRVPNRLTRDDFIELEPNDPYIQVGHCVCALLGGTLGGLLSCTIPAPLGQRNAVSGANAAASPLGHESVASDTRRTTRRHLLISLVGTLAVIASGIATILLGSDLLSDATLLLTCGVLGLAVVGAVFNANRLRAIWFGAALFGWGYLMLVFNTRLTRDDWPSFVDAEPPRLVTVLFLDDSRAQVPLLRQVLRPSWAADPENRPILEALERPFPTRLSVDKEMSLEVFLHSIRDDTRSAAIPWGIPFFVDLFALQKQEVTMDSPVELESDLRKLPLRVALKHLLRGWRLDYLVRNGTVYITSWNDVLAVSLVYDKNQRVGHCLISLLMACLGGAAAGFVYPSSHLCQDTI
jgi:hypothetical protein